MERPLGFIPAVTPVIFERCRGFGSVRLRGFQRWSLSAVSLVLASSFVSACTSNVDGGDEVAPVTSGAGPNTSSGSGGSSAGGSSTSGQDGSTTAGGGSTSGGGSGGDIDRGEVSF